MYTRAPRDLEGRRLSAAFKNDGGAGLQACVEAGHQDRALAHWSVKMKRSGRARLQFSACPEQAKRAEGCRQRSHRDMGFSPWGNCLQPILQFHGETSPTASSDVEERRL